MNESMHSFHSTRGCVGDRGTELSALPVKKQTPTGSQLWHQAPVCATRRFGCSGLWLWPKEEWEHAGNIQILCPRLWAAGSREAPTHVTWLSIRVCLSVVNQRTLNRADTKQMLQCCCFLLLRLSFISELLRHQEEQDFMAYLLLTVTEMSPRSALSLH